MFHRPESYSYHDLDFDSDLEDESQTRTVAPSSQLHLRFPEDSSQACQRNSSQPGKEHVTRPEHSAQGRSRDGDQLLLSEMNGAACRDRGDDVGNIRSPDNELLSDCHDNESRTGSYDDQLLAADYDDDDALLTLEKELDEQEDTVSGVVDVVFDFLGKCFVTWPHPCFPGSAIVLIVMTIVTAVVAVLACMHFPPQRILDDIMEDASMGFETRGTYLRKTMSTASRIRWSVRQNDSSLSICPDQIAVIEKLGLPLPPMPALPMNVTPVERAKFFCNNPDYGQPNRPRERRGADKPPSNITENGNSDGYVPVIYSGVYMVFVFESKSKNKDMFNAKAIHDLCDVTEKKILPMFPTSGQFQYGDHRSLADLMQKYLNISSCREITEEDVDRFREQLHVCRHSLVKKRSDDVTRTTTQASYATCDGPWRPLFMDAATYLLDTDFFLQPNPQAEVTYSTLLVSLRDPGAILDMDDEQVDFYEDHIAWREIAQGQIRLTAVKFPIGEDLKWNLFQKYIVSDIRWFVLALLLVVTVMLIYLLRLDLVIATIISICAGFMLAYATYYAIFGLKFFPFINILGLLILIAIGADDVFVFFDIFEQVRVSNSNLKLNRIISKTLSHAVSSIFVTSFTTASAFYANAVSDITSIKLFGIFAGTAVLLNFFVMVLVVPSVIVLSELFLKCLGVNKCRSRLSQMTGKAPKLMCSRESGIPAKVLGHTWFIWLVVLALLGVAGCIVVFVKPRFQLPVTSDFQLFPASDCMENWDLNVKQHFQFAATENDENRITFYYVWGFQSDDPGNWLNPKDTDGKLKIAKNFDFYDKSSQKWLYKYCKKTQIADFSPPQMHSATICLFEAFEQVVSKLCDRSKPYFYFINISMPECCESESVPFGRTQLENCGPMYQHLYNYKFTTMLDPGNVIEIDVRGRKMIYDVAIYDLKNDRNRTNRVLSYIIPVTTQYTATYEYDVMNGYYEEIAGSFISDIKTAPAPLSDGFCAFTDWFWFYDLQHSLATGTYYSIGLSLFVAFLVMLVTSLNFVITLYAMVTIGLAIACTVALLVLLGWHLNVIESVIISLSVGLSIDFTIHYGVAYRLSREPCCRRRVAESYERVGPAVAMAALTTFLAGAAMMPCHVLAYTKLGVFLMLVMTLAWIYASFFFQSLCWMLGPIGQCPRLRRCGKAPNAPEAPCAQSSGGVNMRSLDEHSDDDSLLVTF